MTTNIDTITNATNATNTTFTTPVRTSCKTTMFPVPLFNPGEYPQKSQQAHSVLGVLLLLMVVVWLLHITQVRTPVKHLGTAYRYSGALQIMLGVYLLSWCFIFLKPSQLDELWLYTTRDLLQLQHISISCSAICCGLAEYWYGTERLKHVQWHVLWCVNMCCIGMVFMVHPQPDFAGAATHTMLGMFIIIGAIFFLGEKWHQFPEDLYESWNIVLAGGLYLFAASLLIKYEEAPIVMHHGYTIRCHRGAPVTFASLIMAMISFLLLLWFGCMPNTIIRGCMQSIEAFHEDPYAACVQCNCKPDNDEDDRSSSSSNRNGSGVYCTSSSNGNEIVNDIDGEEGGEESDMLVPRMSQNGNGSRSNNSSSSSSSRKQHQNVSDGRYSRVQELVSV